VREQKIFTGGGVAVRKNPVGKIAIEPDDGGI
jgi:hypothetical protein